MSGPVDAFPELVEELTAAFDEGTKTPWSEGRFRDLALRVFGYQFDANPVYRRFCVARGGTPSTVTHWTEIPPVPATAFKHVDLAGPAPAPEAVFETSGTTGTGGRRGRHPVPSLALYRASCLPNLRAHVRPEGGPIRILSLIPSPEAAPASSLARMMGFAVETLGAEGSGFFAGPDHRPELEAFAAAAARAVDEGVPVWVAGTAFAFVHWMDAVAGGRVEAQRLPEGSRVMETGGFKGRSRSVSRAELYSGIGTTLGVPPTWVVNEYGMTELLSQFYDGVVGDPSRPAPEARVHHPPPWMRTRAVDPVTLEPVPAGEPGLLLHLDLANLGSVSAVLTEDRGVMEEGGGFRVLGRNPGAEPRGCSLALEELLEGRP